MNNKPSKLETSQPRDQVEPLVDRLGRVHTALRLSVTDRCNIRCFYCMPTEEVRFKPRGELLTFEELERMVQVAASLGITKVRLTGGEPLVRTGLATLVRKIVAVPGITEVALTTNGLLLAEQAEQLKAAGLGRINVSLDTLDQTTFQRITRRQGLDRVLQGIFAARQAGFAHIRLNTVAVRGQTEKDIVPLAHFAREHDLDLRFIEFMPLNATGHWEKSDVLTGAEIRTQLEAKFGALIPVDRLDSSQPAIDYRFTDDLNNHQSDPGDVNSDDTIPQDKGGTDRRDRGLGQIGFINSVSQPFCESCNRLRITSLGQLKNCLFSSVEWDARKLLRGGASQVKLQQLIRDCVAAKEPSHGIGSEQFNKPKMAMYEIGG
ncbi:MAG: GTP 3',8-cyclase MoaA [Pirellulales bacterium]